MADTQTQIPDQTTFITRPAPAAPKRPRWVWPVALLVAVACFFGLTYLGVALTHESTDDAFIAGHVVSVAPRIAGQIISVPVLDNQMVHSNDLLMTIDPADYAMVLAQKNAANDAELANYKSVMAALDLMQTKRATAAATARESQADADAMAAANVRAKADIARAAELRKQNTISAQEFDTSQAAAQEADANLTSAKEKAGADQSRIKEADAQYLATESAATSALAKMRQSQADVDAAQLNVSYTKIFAPTDGRITRKSVEAGDYVQTGQALLAIVPTNVWVVANFKESQLRDMKPGEAVQVEIDALGGRSFAAHVDSIQAGSGAQFSLLPPENATGNFVKVIQRVPVKILFDEALPGDHTIGPGLSVTPSVTVADGKIPRWVIIIASLAAGVLAGVLFGFLARRNGK